MADDVTTPFTPGTKFATDEHPTKGHAEWVKVFVGDDGEFTPLTGTAANGLDVDVTRMPNTPIQYADSPSIDAFGRARVSNSTTLINIAHTYDAQPLFMGQRFDGSGAMSYVQNRSAVRLTVGTDDGARAVHQTKRHLQYLPGKSQCIDITGVLGPRVANVAKRVGYFAEQNGIYFEQNGTAGNRWVIRSNVDQTIGTHVETIAEQAAWNLDKLDGTGSSGITLDETKAHIWRIDFQWLGVGRVRVGFVIDGAIIYCHQFLHANISTGPYMRSGNLPIRWEIFNKAASAGSSMDCICCHAESEGGTLGLNPAFSRGNHSTPVSVSTTLIPVFTIRPMLTYEGRTSRVTVVPKLVELFVDSDIHYHVVLNGTLSGGTTTFSPADDFSAVEYNTGYAAITGGHILSGGYAAGGKSSMPVSQATRNEIAALSAWVDGSRTDTLTIACMKLSAGTANVYAEISWEELF